MMYDWDNLFEKLESMSDEEFARLLMEAEGDLWYKYFAIQEGSDDETR